MKAELFYITDIYCVWCYGFGPMINTLAQEYTDKIDVKIVNGGMLPQDTSFSQMFGRFPDPIALHQRVTDLTGNAFGDAYLNEVKNFRNSKLILNSNVPARAAATLKLLGVQDDLAVAKAIQQAYYQEGRDLQNADVYEQIAAQFNISFEDFRTTYASDEAALAVKEDRSMVEQLGIQGFPAVILRHGDFQFIQVAAGFLPLDALRNSLEEAMKIRAKSSQATGQVCGLDGSGCR